MSFSTIRSVLTVSKFLSLKESDSKLFFLCVLITNSGNLKDDSSLYVILHEIPKNYTLIIELIDYIIIKQHITTMMIIIKVILGLVETGASWYNFYDFLCYENNLYIKIIQNQW